MKNWRIPKLHRGTARLGSEKDSFEIVMPTTTYQVEDYSHQELADTTIESGRDEILRDIEFFAKRQVSPVAQIMPPGETFGTMPGLAGLVRCGNYSATSSETTLLSGHRYGICGCRAALTRPGGGPNGGDNFGDPAHLEGFRVLLNAYDREAKLNAYGRQDTMHKLDVAGQASAGTAVSGSAAPGPATGDLSAYHHLRPGENRQYCFALSHGSGPGYAEPAVLARQ